jgi:shikimate dehydrogenase
MIFGGFGSVMADEIMMLAGGAVKLNLGPFPCGIASRAFRGLQMPGLSAKMAGRLQEQRFPAAAIISLELYQGEPMKNGAITANTRLCAVIGNPVGHSLSPALHNAAFDALGLDYVYVAFRVEDLKSALAGMRALENFRGMSVTIPHKIEAMGLVDEIGEADRAIGSINTILNDNGRLTGLGTDGPGALKALTDAGVEIADRNVLMLGAGGAARAIAFTLARNTGLRKLALLDINESMLQGLTADLRSGTGSCIESAVLTDDSLARAMAEADIIVNCTPIGMHPRADASLIPTRLFRAGQTVFDIVYNPLETRLLADARSRGLTVISGVEMFINQAVLQFERFTGVDAPVEVMRRVVMEKLQE